MSFLLPVKGLRHSKGNLDDDDDDEEEGEPDLEQTIDTSSQLESGTEFSDTEEAQLIQVNPKKIDQENH